MPETIFVASCDLGGSNSRSGLVEYKGSQARFVEESYHSIYTKNEDDLGSVLDEGIGKTVRTYRGMIAGVTLAVAGPIPDHREMQSAANTRCLHDITPYNVANELERRFQLESWCANDVQAACAGEREKGALQGVDWAMLENIGSGWGGAYILNGVPVAAEPGHIWIPGQGRTCGCGKDDCAEAGLSGANIEKRLREMHEAGQISIPDDQWEHPCSFADQEAAKGTPWAVEFYTKVANEIGNIWGSKLNLCPPITDIVYQGSFIECAMRIDFFQQEVRRAMLARSMLPKQHVQVRIQQVAAPTLKGGEPLGPIYGAASIWKRLHDERQAVA